jgi:DNA polymerase III epsilon subunit-like protein
MNQNHIPIAFVDCETTHLSPRHGDAWEIAVVRRREDGTDVECLWQVRPDLTTADPEALAIGRFEERFAVPDGWDAIEFMSSGAPFRTMVPEMLFDVQEALSGAVWIGSNPGFDVAFLSKLLWAHGRKTVWHYRPYDIVQLAAAKVGLEAAGALPWSSRKLSRALGVEPPGDGVAHTALGDARHVRDVFDAITGGAA